MTDHDLLQELVEPEIRYRNDPAFHQLVDLLDHMISQAQYTPSELRDAAMLAAIHYEIRTIRPQFIPLEPGDRPDNEVKP